MLSSMGISICCIYPWGMISGRELATLKDLVGGQNVHLSNWIVVTEDVVKISIFFTNKNLGSMVKCI